MHLFSHGVLLTPGDSHQAICAAGNWCRTQNHWLAVISRKSPAHKVRWNEGVNLLEIEINVKWEKMWEILAQLHMHERLIQPLKSDLIWPLNAVPWSWLKHLRIINYFTTSPADWCGAVRLHTAHSLCIPHLACSFWKMEMKRHAAPRKAASCPAQGSVSTTSWQCPYTATHLGLFLFPPQTHQTPTPWRWGHLVSKSAPNTLQYKHPATPGWGWGLISDKEVETRQITSR